VKSFLYQPYMWSLLYCCLLQINDDGTLYIRRILHRPRKETSDVGRYQCYVTLTNYGTILARDVYVQVLGKTYLTTVLVVAMLGKTT